MYQRRVALEWRTAVAVAPAAAVALLLARLSVEQAWWLSIFVTVLLVGVLAVVAVFRYPVEPPPAMPKRFGYTEATAADKRVRRGLPVDPPELQAAAIGLARRGLRITHLNLGWFPIMGAVWAVRLGEDGLPGGLGYVGLGLMLLGATGLAWSGITQQRLDHLEDTTAVDAAHQ